MHPGLPWPSRIVARIVACTITIAMLDGYPYGFADDPQNKVLNPRAERSREPAFDTDIIPLLTKHGCNSGACHGAAVGRGNFALSLFGSDPDRDYRSIVHEYHGRRIATSDPASSLLIAKPSGGIAHGGNELFEPDSTTAQLLMQWIGRGAPRGIVSALQSVTIQQHEIAPPPTNSESINEKSVRMSVIASFADGTARDVTQQTLFTIDPSSEIKWNPSDAVATLTRPGRYVVIARYMHRVEPVVLLKPFTDSKTLEPMVATSPNTSHWIDVEIDQQLERLGIKPGPEASSMEWFRRVNLDLTGRLPTREELIDFLNDREEGKRRRWVLRLVASDSFIDYWTYRMARLLGLRSIASDRVATEVFARWIRESVAADRPFPEMVRELLTSDGDSHQVGPANFVRLTNDPRSHAELVANVFMGTRMQCANCHNHPFDRWTQDDYHGLAAIFAGTERGRIVRHSGRGQVTNLRTREPALPRIPGFKYIDAPGNERMEQTANSEKVSVEKPNRKDRVEQFADWLTQEDNPLLAKVMANRLWRAMMGRGLVEPSDDFRETNPPSHPELLHRLAQEYRESGYQLRPLLMQIALSDAYGRTSQSSESPIDASFFAVAMRKSLPPEVLLDAVHDALGVGIQDAKSGGATRAVRWIDPSEPNSTLDILGRCSRGTVCGDTVPATGLSAQLHWMNGDVVNSPLLSGKTFFDPMLASDAPARRIIETAYLRILSREPTVSELEHWEKAMPAASPEQRAARQAWVQDWIWSMLSTSEFQSNH